MPHRTRPMAALLIFTGLNAVLLSTITPVYDSVCFHPYWERRMLAKNVETLNKAMEVEAKRMRREVAVRDKEVAAMRGDKERNQNKIRSSGSKGAINGSLSLSARIARNAIGLRS